MIMEPLSTVFRSALTSTEIDNLKDSMNYLICQASPEGENRKHALSMELPDQIEEYIRIAQSAEKCPYFTFGPELAVGLRKLLVLVNRYYSRLN